MTGRNPGAFPTPARSRSPAEALEMQVEAMWLRLNELGAGVARTVRLSERSGRLVMAYPGEDPLPDEVGTYTKGVTLQQLREDVFFMWEGGK